MIDTGKVLKKEALVWILLIMIAVIAAVSAYFFLKVQYEQEVLTFTVTRTEKGFFPDPLVIPKGGRVVFTNISDEYFWPASDLHPTHYVYSEFDPRRELEPGERWSFTFKKTGYWAYHDHLQPRLSGAVMVLPVDEPERFSNCVNKDDQEQCWGVLLTHSLKQSGLKETFTLFHSLHETNPSFARRCHQISHEIGLKTFALYGQDVKIIPEMGFCGGGFFHGYLEGYVGAGFDPANLDQYCENVAQTLGDRYPGAENICRHGIGHGVGEYIIFNRADLWGDLHAMAEVGIPICEASNETYEEKWVCSSGVFATLTVWAFGHSRFKSDINENNMYRLCEAQTKEHAKRGCYHEVAQRYWMLHYPDIEKALHSAAQSMPERGYDEYAAFSVHSIATLLGNQVVHDKDSEKIVGWCRGIPEELQTNCIVGFASGMTGVGEPYEEEEAGLRFCKTKSLTDDEKHRCYETVQEFILSSYSPERISAVCTQIPEEYQKSCNI